MNRRRSLDEVYPPKIANALRAAGGALDRLDEIVPELERHRQLVAEIEAIVDQTRAILRVILADDRPVKS